ncbi:hypothetical protein CKF54_03915 [Psittacicella hinzii]|uniref:Guanidinium exporter n=1 Tax=Psittacicella hinzii TaxID=2028575 RepID=A0A3A1Y6I8_9GAMM|nr:hypothetical protein CKF54_03915 [Psittacicella hinzii]
MAWIFLIVAGLFEVGWPLGLKLANSANEFKILGWVIASVCMALSGFCLYSAIREIPMGIAYAVWTGIGAAGTFVIGVLFFKDPATFLSWVGVGMIVGGVALLKLSTAGH